MAATLRTRKFMTNRLLGRKQFVSGGERSVGRAPGPAWRLAALMAAPCPPTLQVLDVLHPGRANVSKVRRRRARDAACDRMVAAVWRRRQ